jgi:hypothetical protein
MGRLWPRLRHAAAANPQSGDLKPIVPLVIVLTIALFALLGGWAWKGAGNRPAKVGLVCGILGLVGVLAFFPQRTNRIRVTLSLLSVTACRGLGSAVQNRDSREAASTESLE